MLELVSSTRTDKLTGKKLESSKNKHTLEKDIFELIKNQPIEIEK